MGSTNLTASALDTRPAPTKGTFTSRESATIARAMGLIETKCLCAGPLLNDSSAVDRYLRLRFAGLEREEFHALFLDANLKLIAAELISIGTLTSTAIYPREVARAALTHNAAAVVLAHNHPSGNCTPSNADLEHHEHMERALSILDIRLVDNMVVTASRTISIPGYQAEKSERERQERKLLMEHLRAERAAARAAKKAARASTAV